MCLLLRLTHLSSRVYLHLLVCSNGLCALGSGCEDIRAAVQRVDAGLGTQLDVHQNSAAEQEHQGPKAPRQNR